MARYFLKVEEGLPLVGHLAFGIVDRGTNLLQIRPTSFCPLSCVFCSVDAGPRSTRRLTEFLVDHEYLVSWFVDVAKAKGLDKAHAYIDAVGDPLTYGRIIELVRLLSSTGVAESITIETHGALLTRELVDKLADAGLTRINLSVDALDPSLARTLAGTPWFDVNRVISVAEYIASSTDIDLLIAPVWVPGVNDSEIPRIIEWALRIGAGKRVPPLGIQKYEEHKYGRKPPGVKPMKWHEFYSKLEVWEKEYGVRLRIRPEDFGIRKARALPLAFRKGEKATVSVVYWGWLKGQWLGVARNRVITIVGVPGAPPIGRKVKVRMLRTRSNIYVARLEA
ncbi:radical SAM protein [Thermofilum pendens]|uniref:Radical SAM domain protein n=1 Tax=Thermofilum pendens (strain DSM 2475 / Hrk 5) TaxID=368408 RepID=A1RXY0_THEPD|nr:radical SAM protein [Thermofilum pendens]ABL78060.1 Radical SAM domain protein [Thermofilum pendens Hrk 5]